jgi:phospholipid transport system substrate-binding protein
MLDTRPGEAVMGKALAASLAAWLMVASAMAATPSSPREVVQAAVTRVIAIMQEDPDRQRVERRAEIRRVAAALFDFDEMSRRTLTRHWSGRSAEEHAEFARLFTDLLERSYIGRIEQWSGERISYPGEAVDGAYATVRSKIVTRRAEIALDYRLMLRDGRWRAYDVLVDGVSFVSTFRSEFDRIIQQSSYAGLVDKLRKHAVQTTALDKPARKLWTRRPGD